MQSVDDLFGIGEEGGSHVREHIKDIDISELSPFKDHPFRVLDDEKMQETMESIRGYGVLNPVIVRPKQPYGYEIIAGHRRKRACEILGFDKIPCVIRELSDEEGRGTPFPAFFYLRQQKTGRMRFLFYISEREGFIMADIQFDYFTAAETEQYTFYRIPKALFTESHFQALSCETKVLYGMMLDRLGLSIRNQWFDSQGRAYIWDASHRKQFA